MIVDNLEFHVKSSGSAAAKGTDKLSKSLRQLRGASSNANKGLGAMLHTVTRIGTLMVLRQGIRALMQAMKEGLKQAYAFNSLAGGEMSAALDRLQSAAIQARGALGSAFGEVLANLAPLLIALKNLIISVANAFAQLMAVLGGRGTYTKAVASSEKWADATAKGAKSAKEWKNQLLGFDEINRLEEPSDSSGGGGGTSPYSGAFELAEATNEWAKKLREITMDWWHSLNFEPIIAAWERLKKAVSEFVDIVDRALYWAYINVLLPLAGWTIQEAAPAVVNLLASAFELLNAVLERLAPVFLTFWDNILKPAGEWIGNVFVGAVNYLTEAFSGLAKKVKDAKSFSDFLKSLNGKEALVLGIASAIGVIITNLLMFKTANTLISTATTLFTMFTNPIGWVAAAVGALVTIGIALYQNWEDIKRQVSDLWQGFLDLCEPIAKLVGWLQALFGWARDAVRQLNEVIVAKANANAARIEADGSQYLQGFAEGGFPQTGELFMARENGMPELVGSIGNRTAVANNDQIIAGIRQGVFEAVTSAMSNSAGGEVVLKLDGDVLAKGVTRYQRFNAISANI